MTIIPISSEHAPQPSGGYAQAISLEDHKRLLFISGQIPVAPDGATPPDFRAQCELVWANVEAQLRAAGMTTRNLVKVTTLLSSRRFASENSEIRQRVLGGHTPALTVIITRIYDEAWLLEVEAVAAA